MNAAQQSDRPPQSYPAAGGGPPQSGVFNPAGQPRLRYRAAPHAQAMTRMRAALSAAHQPLAVRLMAGHNTDDPALALLDAWAVVCDIVSFYQERIADEGFLRTARRRDSVRELARTLGHELRPGVSAQTHLAFSVEDSPGAPSTAVVAAGTPVQSVPGQDQLPQTFETTAALTAHVAWNEIAAVDTEAQVFGAGETQIWLLGTGHGLRPGDPLLLIADTRADPSQRPTGNRRQRALHWDFQVLHEVLELPEPGGGWTVLTITPGLGARPDLDLGTPREADRSRDVQVYAFRERANLFGMNAPDPKRFPDETPVDGDWAQFGVGSGELELDGDHPQVLTDSWVVLEQASTCALYLVTEVSPDGAKKYGLSGRITKVKVADGTGLGTFTRRKTLVHCQSVPLPAALRPRRGTLAGPELELRASQPTLPEGRLVLVTGTADDTRQPAVEPATVSECLGSGPAMTVKFQQALRHRYVPSSVRVLGNVVAATHGETVLQVLGSGDGRASFAEYLLRRGPLTYVRAGNAAGAVDTLEVRVDDVRWSEVESLADAAATDRVYSVRTYDDGEVGVVFGDGVHGARPSTGIENITARYRVGIGQEGRVDADGVSLLVQRPLGIRQVRNPAATHDWAPPEDVDQSRANAALRVRTLDRAVSVTDHEDFARGFAGIGRARADLVWDGRRHLVAVSVLGVDGREPGDGLLADLRTALVNARDPGTELMVCGGRMLTYALTIQLAHHPDHERAAVEAAVRASLRDRLGPARADFASTIAASQVLVAAGAVPGVLAVTMPRLVLVGTGAPQPPGPGRGDPPGEARPGSGPVGALLIAQPARWVDGDLAPAQALSLAGDQITIAEMP
ncbi:baseplate J/gp47 family protein [Catellatospora chokoriensis]|uniref:Putative baseplate assembly protein n=1 Tax=Catellatospora chokoriensis TaxID=310353 RepID=A0A8J3K0D6_9ACTN|nr:baseplate J/gp47 family protein [Catellatospora chokoriensis]GIF90383.1 putative baseplate assembly protein [Catellatospora chokoriensis]